MNDGTNNGMNDGMNDGMKNGMNDGTNDTNNGTNTIWDRQTKSHKRDAQGQQPDTNLSWRLSRSAVITAELL